jgi:CRISPR/Cas system CMR-associated protein Cmr5 small subunit
MVRWSGEFGVCEYGSKKGNIDSLSRLSINSGGWKVNAWRK